ncbi:DUF3788 family protein [Novosphingobium sp. G106]|uniref:DUF3788 family protein n=2 Tax=Novosphingobium sp. G106 TaxID=2849500 RepID=UPI0020C26E93|nr:DUF3788 family protein [Novosphingobium sp. G106]
MTEAIEMEDAPRIGARITDKSAIPDDEMVHSWIGTEAFAYWLELRAWIEQFYPGLFMPEWLYGGQNKGWSLRYKNIKAFCTFCP